MTRPPSPSNYPSSTDSQFSTLIAELYRSIVDTPPWQRFICSLRQYFDCDVAGLSCSEPDASRRPASVWSSRIFNSAEALKRAAAHRKQYGHLDPLAGALTQSADILTLDEVIDRRLFKETMYYREFAQKYPLDYQIAARIAVPGGPTYHLGLCNGPGRRNFGSSDKRSLQALPPHVRNALNIYSIRQSEALHTRIYSNTLSMLAAGTIIVDMKGQVIQMNDAAQDMINRQAGLTLIKNCPTPTNPRQRYDLRRMIAEASRWTEMHCEHDFVDMLNLGVHSGMRIGLAVRSIPIQGGMLNDTGPRAILHINGLEGKIGIERALICLFGLTPSEASLAGYLAEGYTIKQAAIELGLTESSARTYSKRVLSKTGSHRQVDLVRLILKSIIPLCG